MSEEKRMWSLMCLKLGNEGGENGKLTRIKRPFKRT